MRAHVYVDGFNLYYSALRKRFPEAKWLDLFALARLLFPQDSIARVRYFTARISDRGEGADAVVRQQTYLRALAATGVDVHLGQFRHDRRFMHRVEPCTLGAQCPTGDLIEMDYTEEKGSDVNLASYLLRDAALSDCELAIVVTNDTDLVEPLRMVRTEFGVATMLLSPAEHPSNTLREAAGSIKRLRGGALAAAQLGTDLSDAKGQIRRPRAWRPTP